jgi:hypothetical protein
VANDIYHQRRKQTNYLVGMDDLEISLAQLINSNASSVIKLEDQ